MVTVCASLAHRSVRSSSTVVFQDSIFRWTFYSNFKSLFRSQGCCFIEFLPMFTCSSIPHSVMDSKIRRSSSLFLPLTTLICSSQWLILILSQQWLLVECPLLPFKSPFSRNLLHRKQRIINIYWEYIEYRCVTTKGILPGRLLLRCTVDGER